MKPRPLTPADAAAYFALRQASLVDSPFSFLGTPGDDYANDVAAMAESLSKPDIHVMAIADEADPSRLVAAAGVSRMARIKQRHRAFIWGVYCDPRVRGRGYGRAVVKAAIEQARAWPGVDIVALAVAAGPAAAAARALYRSLGFIEWGKEPDAIRVNGVSDDEHHMVLRL